MKVREKMNMRRIRERRRNLWSDYCLVEKILKMEVRFFTYLSERK
jgi:hypothetical protein